MEILDLEDSFTLVVHHQSEEEASISDNESDLEFEQTLAAAAAQAASDSSSSRPSSRRSNPKNGKSRGKAAVKKKKPAAKKASESISCCVVAGCQFLVNLLTVLCQVQECFNVRQVCKVVLLSLAKSRQKYSFVLVFARVHCQPTDGW